MAVGPEGPERLRRAQSPPGHCLGCSACLFPGLGLRAMGLVLLGAGGGAGCGLSSASAGGWAAVWKAQTVSGVLGAPGLAGTFSWCLVVVATVKVTC